MPVSCLFFVVTDGNSMMSDPRMRGDPETTETTSVIALAGIGLLLVSLILCFSSFTIFSVTVGGALQH